MVQVVMEGKIIIEVVCFDVHRSWSFEFSSKRRMLMCYFIPHVTCTKHYTTVRYTEIALCQILSQAARNSLTELISAEY